MAVIRPPVLEDYAQISTMGRWFQENSDYQNCGWSERKVAHIILSSTDESSPYFMRVAEENGELIGMFLGLVTEYFFSEEQIAMEQVVFFYPEKRKGVSRSLVKMFGEFEDWAKKQSAREICLGVTSGIAGDGYEKLIERVGYRRAGSIFKREI